MKTILKRCLSLFLASLCLLPLMTACGTTTPPKETEPDSESPKTDAAADPATEPATESETETEAPATETEAPATETEAPATETEAPETETEAPETETEAPATNPAEWGTVYEVTFRGGFTGATKYDVMLAMACIQGIMNRESPNKVYINSTALTERWQSALSEEGRWMENMTFEKVDGFEGLIEVGLPYIREIILWDEKVPATENVACTMAGVEDGVVMSPTLYETYKDRFPADIPVVDLRGKFDGSVTGSAKNDAYRWAIENYLAKGLCSTDFLCYYFDGAFSRSGGDTVYVMIRDWAIYNRAFVFDLSPWADETPFDDRKQKLGTDKETLGMVLAAMQEQTKGEKTFEVCGFSSFVKYSKWSTNTISRHDPVHTEWEFVYLLTPYGGYQNTTVENSWNQSFHSQYEIVGNLENNEPPEMLELDDSKTYLCFYMGDYDASFVLYDKLRTPWADKRRGEIPLNWAINPNLIDTYPDLVAYYYETATDNDYFMPSAGAAGYFNPSQVKSEFWPVMIEHNQYYFNKTGMSVAPMVLDVTAMGEEELNAFQQFAPNGIATVINNFTNKPGTRRMTPSVYNDTMPYVYLVDHFGSISTPKNAAKWIADLLGPKNRRRANVVMLRVVWETPTAVIQTVEEYKKLRPTENVEIVDIYNYFNLKKQFHDRHGFLPNY